MTSWKRETALIGLLPTEACAGSTQTASQEVVRAGMPAGWEPNQCSSFTARAQKPMPAALMRWQQTQPGGSGAQPTPDFIVSNNPGRSPHSSSWISDCLTMLKKATLSTILLSL